MLRFVCLECDSHITSDNSGDLSDIRFAGSIAAEHAAFYRHSVVIRNDVPELIEN